MSRLRGFRLDRAAVVEGIQGLAVAFVAAVLVLVGSAFMDRDDEELQRSVGRLQTRVGRLQTRVANLEVEKTELRAVNADLVELAQALEERNRQLLRFIRGRGFRPPRSPQPASAETPSEDDGEEPGPGSGNGGRNGDNGNGNGRPPPPDCDLEVDPIDLCVEESAAP